MQNVSGTLSFKIGAGLAFLFLVGCKATVTSGSQNSGGAVVESVFGDLVASNAQHDVGTTAITLSEEQSSIDLPTGYREVPDVLKDDDGMYSTNCYGGAYGTCTPVVKAVAPTVDCGLSQTSLDARIADCAAQNTTAATWDGSVNGTHGEATWKLVTKSSSGAEVWRDERTGLVWSDSDTTDYNWCYAAGNVQQDDPAGICNDSTLQDQSHPFSVCAEPTGAQAVFAGDDYGAGTYSDLKGGMGKLSTVSVHWRLPTKYDWEQADVDGVRFVLPNFSRDANVYNYWTATSVSGYRNVAFFFQSGGYMTSDNYRSGAYEVRCVGR